MKKRKGQLLFSSNFKFFSAPFFIILFAVVFTTVVRAHGGNVSLIHACVSNLTGTLKIVGANDACGVNEAALDWIKNVFAGTGLSASSDATGITLSIADGGVTTVKLADDVVTSAKILDGAIGTSKLADAVVTTAKLADSSATTDKVANSAVTTSKLADGAVTPDKISNDASESPRVYTWVDDSNTYTLNASGGVTSVVIPTDITVTVPSGKAYYYTVVYGGGLLYNYGERITSSFYGTYSARLLANSTPVSVYMGLIGTGARYSWDALGAVNYWRTDLDATWLVRLTEGTHTLKVEVNGYSDSTMNYAHFQYNRLQVMRVF